MVKKIFNWMKQHRPQMIAICGGATILLFGGIIAYLLNQPEPVMSVAPVAVKPEPPPPVYFATLSGEEVPDASQVNSLITAVMIENSPDARPQSGIKDADVIFEAIAEGGITRFMTFYQNSNPKLIGPVRSLRPYFVDWSTPFDASIAHVGGSAKALRQVRSGSYRDMDQFFNGSTYWRASDRYAPHNVYTSMAKLNQLSNKKKYTASSFAGFNRQDSAPAKEPSVSRFNINISGPAYNLRYVYDAKNNRYNRVMGGVAHKDREKGQLSPKVVIAMMVDERTVQEDGARESIKITGSGVAYLFQNGEVQKVTWVRPKQTDVLKLEDADGKAVALSRGQTWITAVPNGQGSVKW